MTRQIKQRWYSGHEILNMGVKGFELLEAVKGNKLIPHDKYTGKKVVYYDTLPRRQLTLEEIETLVPRRISQAPPPISPLPSAGTTIKYRAKSRPVDIKATAKWIYENEKPEIPILPNDYIMDRFTLESVKGFIYTADEITFFLTILNPEPQPDIAPLTDQNTTLAPLETTRVSEDAAIMDYDSFIKGAKISYKSDIEIEIQSSKKPPRVYSFKEFGFKNPQNKGWLVVVQSLKTGFFSVGPFVKGEKNAEYDRRQKHLAVCEQKLRIFFKQEYGLKIPDDFKFFRLSHDEPPGTYKPIFSIAKSDLDNFEAKCKRLSDQEIKAEINGLIQEAVKDGIGQAKKNEIMTKFNILAAEARRRGIVNLVTGRDNQEENPDLEIGRDAPEDGGDESLLE